MTIYKKALEKTVGRVALRNGACRTNIPLARSGEKAPQASRPWRFDFSELYRQRRIERRSSLQREHGIDLGLDLGLGRAACDGYLLDQQMFRRVHHLPLAEGQVLAVLEDEEITQDLGDLVDGARLDLLQVLAVTLVPRLFVDRDVTGTKDFVYLGNFLGRDQLAQPEAWAVSVGIMIFIPLPRIFIT